MKMCIAILVVLTISVGLRADAQTECLKPSTMRIVKKLRNESMLHFGAPVGYAGVPETKNKYYKLYLRLRKTATTSELAELTKDSSKYILVYAYNILHSRNYSGLKEIFLNHKSDASEVWQAGGCTGVVWKVNSYMLYLLSPKFNKNSVTYLSESEYSDLFREIGY